MHNYDFTPMFRHSVGFDRIQRLMASASARSEASYPPYNIEADGENTYRIIVAVAGFDKKDLDITLEEDTLSIIGKKEDEAEDVSYLHRGIAGRSFQLKFNLADHIKVHNADLANGELKIDLKCEVPEALKPRQIEIKTRQAKTLEDKPKKMITGEDQAA
jgi:molecular chaperone IbpA